VRGDQAEISEIRPEDSSVKAALSRPPCSDFEKERKNGDEIQPESAASTGTRGKTWRGEATTKKKTQIHHEGRERHEGKKDFYRKERKGRKLIKQ
jgi:hypothetical protein